LSSIYCEDRASALLEPHLTHQGFLRVESVIGRPGVLTYTQPDGTVRRELRPPEELQKAASLDTAVGIPVTNGHPIRAAIPLNPQNVRKYEVGHTGDQVSFDGKNIKTLVMVKDQYALKEIGDGKIQLSPAYFKELDYTSGVWEDEQGQKHSYDAIQREIRYDHVAIVKAGRAGSSVALGLSTDGIDFEPGPVPDGGTMSVQLSLDGGVQVPIAEPGVAGLITTALQKRDAKITELEAAVKASETKTQELQASLDAKDAELEKVKSSSKTIVSPEAVKARLALERKAGDILGDKVSLDELPDIDVKRAVIASVYPSLKDKVAEAEAAYVDASYDTACVHYESQAADEAKRKAAGPRVAMLPGMSADAQDGKPKLSAREKFVARQQANRNKTPREILAARMEG
jgi:hypothetical protein